MRFKVAGKGQPGVPRKCPNMPRLWTEIGHSTYTPHVQPLICEGGTSLKCTSQIHQNKPPWTSDELKEVITYAGLVCHNLFNDRGHLLRFLLLYAKKLHLVNQGQSCVYIMASCFRTTQFSFGLPKNPDAILHGHLSILKGCLMVHLTTTAPGESSLSTTSLGSFVYAMPDRLNVRSAIGTPIITLGSTFEFATRLSKILAIKLQIPVYVGCSMNLTGSTVEEEMDGLTKIVDEIVRVTSS